MAEHKAQTGETPATVYEQLAAAFDKIHQLPGRGGSPDLDYITGEQAISRLNQVLGHDGWAYRIVDHGIHVEADEIWVLGELTVYGAAGPRIRQQFGSQQIKRYGQRSQTPGKPLEIGFDLKGAATDALKKCASLVGVGLYLYEKEAVADMKRRTAETAVAPRTAAQTGTSASGATNAANAAHRPAQGQRGASQPRAAAAAQAVIAPADIKRTPWQPVGAERLTNFHKAADERLGLGANGIRDWLGADAQTWCERNDVSLDTCYRVLQACITRGEFPPGFKRVEAERSGEQAPAAAEAFDNMALAWPDNALEAAANAAE